MKWYTKRHMLSMPPFGRSHLSNGSDSGGRLSPNVGGHRDSLSVCRKANIPAESRPPEHAHVASRQTFHFFTTFNSSGEVSVK